jgi:hypothetical protein
VHEALLYDLNVSRIAVLAQTSAEEPTSLALPHLAAARHAVQSGAFRLQKTTTLQHYTADL